MKNPKVTGELAARLVAIESRLMRLEKESERPLMSMVQSLGPERYRKYMTVASGASMFGIPICDMDSADLLAIIGYICSDNWARSELETAVR